ncbi:N-acetylmuramoyl-L-alanine amidase [Nocardioides dokdonensis]|nr:N-acetylmuramoyl-L-alanine amidase [Nocardioides dokdonensis]
MSSPEMQRRALVTTAAALAAGPALGVLAGPAASARAGGVASHEIALDGRRLASSGRGRWATGRLDTAAYRMLAATWTGPAPTLRVRTRSSGRWSPWQVLRVLHDGPDRTSGEGSGRAGTDPLWVAESDAVEVVVVGRRPDDLRLVLIHPGKRGEDERATGSIPAGRAFAEDDSGEVDETGSGRKRARRSPRPRLLSRGDWGADESWRDGRPVMCRTIQQVHVHHTASGNDYSRGDVAGMIRGMYRYHTQSLGWSDIGYNFLVDKFGRTWVGRAGGPGRPVRGAHTLGFNNTSMGVAVIGNFESGKVTPRTVTALVKLAAWKLDKYGRRPSGKVRVYSTGSDRYSKGWVRLRVIDGHRDTNDTACPGQALYAKLPTIRRRTRKRAKKYGGTGR